MFDCYCLPNMNYKRPVCKIASVPSTIERIEFRHDSFLYWQYTVQAAYMRWPTQ
jgi:hypothetical protein